jgi:hypothetical protein
MAGGCGSGADGGAATAGPARDRAALAVEPDGARPRAVPPDFQATPYGYFHPSCVVEVREDEVVRGDALHRKDGTRRGLAACAHPSYDARGGVRLPDAAPPPYIDWGWIEATETRAGPVEWLGAKWTVPSAPAEILAQTIYLFPGIVPLATGDSILQPVLGWNAQRDQAWTIASWNCCRSGNALHTPLLQVPTGAEVTGTVSGSGCDVATGVCATWAVQTSASSGAAGTLDTDSYGQPLDRTFAGALEVYDVGTCAHLPASGSVTFREVGVRAVGGAQLLPTWRATYWPVSPSCSYGVVIDPAATWTSLRWCGPATCAGLCGEVRDDCGGVLQCPPCTATSGCKRSSRCCEPGATQCALCVPTKQQCPP